MASDLRTVWESLGLERGDCFALSAVYRKEDETPVLVAASLIAGPPTLAEVGWPGWRLAEGFRPVPRAESLDVPPSFGLELDNAVVGRIIMSQDEAYEWLRSVIERGVSPQVGTLPNAQAPVGRAAAPIRVTTHSQTTAGRLAAWLVRPITGFHFRSEDPIGVPDPANRWEANGKSHFSPALDLLGMTWFDNQNGERPAGLLVGSFERNAWLLSQKLDNEHDLYVVNVGIQPERTDPADLEITVKEQVAGEVVLAEHLRLEDTDLRGILDELLTPQSDSSRAVISVGLPTLGRRIRRSVMLFHRDHGLLDEWESFNIVEAISISLDVGGGPESPITTGEKRPAQDLVALLGAVERVRSQYASLRQEGANNRIFSNMAAGRPVLRGMLRRARGEVLVVDPWFRDWDLLDDVGDQPPRVLIGGAVDPPPATFAGRARQWQESGAPFHDRFFLWRNGGVSVGTSANTFGDRLFRVARLGAAESEVLQIQFSLWWDDPGFRPT
jgi:hypothetical protein